MLYPDKQFVLHPHPMFVSFTRCALSKVSFFSLRLHFLLYSSTFVREKRSQWLPRKTLFSLACKHVQERLTCSGRAEFSPQTPCTRPAR